jgi:hypothetical protein
MLQERKRGCLHRINLSIILMAIRHDIAILKAAASYRSSLCMNRFPSETIFPEDDEEEDDDCDDDAELCSGLMCA